MTPEELLLCRISVQMGLAPAEVRQMSALDYDLLARYWKEEPWGPWRDNLHAAIIAREIRRPAFAKNPEQNALDDFMVKDPEERRQQREEQGRKRVAGLFNMMRATAVKVKASALKMPKLRKKPKKKTGLIQPKRPVVREAPRS